MEEEIGFTPFNNWALVKPDENQKEAGILKFADDAVRRPQTGKIVAVGERLEKDLGVGDYLFFQQHGNVEINVNNQDLLLVNKDQMLGRFKD